MIKRYNIKKFRQINSGYTILETMIAVSLFLIVAIIGTSGLLNAHAVYKKSQDMRSIVDNLNFIMEDISRNVRTGSNYHCISNVSVLGDITTPASCIVGEGIAFEETHGSSSDPYDQWAYVLYTPDGGSHYNLLKSTTSTTAPTETWTQLNSSEINFGLGSGFSVLGAEGLGLGDQQQPLVILKLVGTINYKNTSTPFSIQTSISQRLVDN